MANKIDFGWEGFAEFDQMLTQMVDDFGYKDARRILTRSVRRAMKPVLEQAKINAPVDTGALERLLWLESRKPTNRDRRSKYVDRTDAVIASVTTPPSTKLAKLKFFNQRADKKGRNAALQERGIKHFGIKSDMRAIAQEFGTAKVPAQPYLRPALESNHQTVVDSLGSMLGIELDKYKAPKATRKK